MASANSGTFSPPSISKLRFESPRVTTVNVSDFLSIIGANANVVKMTREDAALPESTRKFGWFGFGDVKQLLPECSFAEPSDCVPLNKKRNAQVPLALLNMLHPRSEAFIRNCWFSHCTELRDNDQLWLSAAFAQGYICKKDERSEPNIYQKVFAFIMRGTHIYFLTANMCVDVTRLFEENAGDDLIWTWSGLHRVLFSDAGFTQSNGRVFCIVFDNKLLLHYELHQLRGEYRHRFGNLEHDKSLTPRDWAEISSLNASISEAESFTLETDESDIEDDDRPAEGVLSITLFEERYNLCTKIKRLERKLHDEQDRFERAMIPGEAINEERVKFFERWMLPDAAREESGAATLLKESRKANIMGPRKRRSLGLAAVGDRENRHRHL